MQARLSLLLLLLFVCPQLTRITGLLLHRNAIIIITDGVFSMDGDLAKLPKIVDLAKKYDALTMVDDAHGEGVLGKGGRGLVNHFGLEGEVDIEIGSLSKAFSVMGGFIAAKQPLIDCYLMQARLSLLLLLLFVCPQLTTTTDRLLLRAGAATAVFHCADHPRHCRATRSSGHAG
jgi:hypothetical protein